MDLHSLLEELEEQKPLKWDQKIDSSQLQMVAKENRVNLQVAGKEESLSVTKPCHDQIAERLEIPTKYYQKMKDEAPELLAHNVNTWLKAKPREFFIRGLGGSVRALLSDKYRVIDHLDVIWCALNELQVNEVLIEDCYLSETEMNVKIKNPELKDFIRSKDDLILGGLLLVNSETGHRALRVEPRVFRVKCTNGMVIEEFITRQIHLGNGNNGYDEEIYVSMRRSIRELFGRFGEIVLALRESTEIKITSPLKVIGNVVEHYRLSEDQKASILMAFGAEPELDQYGIANAITRAAKTEENWERGLEMERIGGKVLALPMKEFKKWDE